MEIGVIAPSHCASPYYISAISGRFKEAGLNVRVTPYADMKNAVKDLLGGKLQAAQLTVPLFMALKAGEGAVDSPKPIVATQITGTEGGAIVTGKGMKAKTLDDLEGMDIASHTKLTVHYLILATLMERKKFSKESIENIHVRPLNTMIPGLKSSEIDAFIMPEPVNSLASAKGAGDIFVRTKMLWPGHPCCLTASTEKFLDTNREMYQAFTDVMVRTGLEIDDPATRAGMLSILKRAEPYAKLPPAVLAEAFSVGQSGFEPYPYISSFMAAATMMRERRLLNTGSMKGKDLGIDSGFIEKAYANLGIELPESMRTEKVAGRVMA